MATAALLGLALAAAVAGRLLRLLGRGLGGGLGLATALAAARLLLGRSLALALLLAAVALLALGVRLLRGAAGVDARARRMTEALDLATLLHHVGEADHVVVELHPRLLVRVLLPLVVKLVGPVLLDPREDRAGEVLGIVEVHHLGAELVHDVAVRGELQHASAEVRIRELGDQGREERAEEVTLLAAEHLHGAPVVALDDDRHHALGAVVAAAGLGAETDVVVLGAPAAAVGAGLILHHQTHDGVGAVEEDRVLDAGAVDADVLGGLRLRHALEAPLTLLLVTAAVNPPGVVGIMLFDHGLCETGHVASLPFRAVVSLTGGSKWRQVWN